MKILKMSARRIIPLIILASCFALPVYGQDARLRIDTLDRFNSTATEVVDVTVDQNLIQLALKFLRDSKPDERKVKEILKDLKGVYVKRFGFDSEGQITSTDIEPIREQLRAPGWSRIVGVRSKKKTPIDVEVFLMSEGSVIKGLGVLAIEPKAITVVNVVGPIDLEKLSELEGTFGIPAFDLVQGRKSKSEEEKPEEKKPEPEQTPPPTPPRDEFIEKKDDDTVIKATSAQKVNAQEKKRPAQKKRGRP